MAEFLPLLVAVLAFGCVVIIVFVSGRYIANYATMHRRLPVPASTASGQRGLPETAVPNFFLASLAGKIDEKRFGIEGPIRTKLHEI
jgi:hypothetical protein